MRGRTDISEPACDVIIRWGFSAVILKTGLREDDLFPYRISKMEKVVFLQKHKELKT